jgi:putative ABC transport system permease protein
LRHRHASFIQSVWRRLGIGTAYQAVIPIQQFITTIWNNPDIAIHVKARQLAELEDAREELRHAMRKIRRLQPNNADDFAINQQEQFVQMFNRVAGTIAAVGFFITGLSLFVGGIGIMNIMKRAAFVCWAD